MATSDSLPDPSDDVLQVADPEDYNQNRRLRQIHNARERFPRVAREEYERVDGDDGGEISLDRYQEIITDALIDYLIEVEPLMRNKSLIKSSLDDVDDRESLPDASPFWNEETIEVDGGREVTLETIVEENGYVRSAEGDGEPQTLRLRDARAAYRLTNRYLERVGFGLELDQGLPTDSIP